MQAEVRAMAEKAVSDTPPTDMQDRELQSTEKLGFQLHKLASWADNKKSSVALVGDCVAYSRLLAQVTMQRDLCMPSGAGAQLDLKWPIVDVLRAFNKLNRDGIQYNSFEVLFPEMVLAAKVDTFLQAFRENLTDLIAKTVTLESEKLRALVVKLTDFASDFQYDIPEEEAEKFKKLRLTVKGSYDRVVAICDKCLHSLEGNELIEDSENLLCHSQCLIVLWGLHSAKSNPVVFEPSGKVLQCLFYVERSLLHVCFVFVLQIILHF